MNDKILLPYFFTAYNNMMYKEKKKSSFAPVEVSPPGDTHC